MRKTNLLNRLMLLVAAVALIGNTYAQSCPEGLVSYWTMDETSGTTFTDIVSGNNATLHNTTIDPIAGKVDGGNFFTFTDGIGPGNGQYATAPDNDIYSFPANSGFTISYWLKFTEIQYGLNGGQDHLIISKGDWNNGGPNTSFWASGVNGSGFISFMLTDESGNKTDLEGRVYGQDNFDDNQWHHVACVRNGVTDECMIYVDGRVTDSKVVDYSVGWNNSAPIYIGSLTNGSPQYFYWGGMDELAIFNKALTKAEIDEIIANGNKNPGEGLCNLIASPVFNSTPVTKASVGAPYTYTAHAKGTQSGMTYSLISKPAGMNIDASSGVISWNPASINLDAYVQVVANNTIAPADTQSFRIFLTEGGADCPSGLMTYHKLNEKSGTTYADYQGNHNAAIAPGYNAPVPATGLIGDGAQTFGANTGLDIPDNGTEFDWGQTNSFSFESWFRTTSKGVAALSRNRIEMYHATSWWIGTSPEGYGIMELRDNAATNTVLKGTKVISDGNWHHVVGVRDGVANQNRIYVDGVLEKTLDQVFADDFSAPGSLPVAIGYLTPYDGENELHFIGDIDEVAIFTRALTANEITAFYNGGSPTGHCTASNYAPALVSTPVTATKEDALYSYTFVVDDINDKDTLTLSAPVKPAWASFNWTPGNKTATLTGTPHTAGTYNVTLRVTDNHIVRNQVFTITVANVIDAPVITSTPLKSVDEKVLYTYNLTVTDTDATDTITITKVTLPSWLTFNWTAGSKTATITGTPAKVNVGANPIKISISDGYVTTNEEYTLTVNAVGGPPVIIGQSALSVDEDKSITINKADLTITDPDNPLSEITIAVQPGTNYSFTGNTVTPAANFNGPLSVKVKAHDLTEYSDEFTVLVTVKPINDPPVITSSPGLTATVGNLYYYILSATDVDNATLTKSTVFLPGSWLKFNEVSGVLQGTPELSNVGDNHIILQVTDGQNVAPLDYILNVSTTTSISKVQEDEFVIYPVPVKDELNIKFNNFSEETLVDIVSLTGSIVESVMVPANTEVVSIPVNNIQAGLYICHIKNNNINATSRFIIKR
jgi:hypothetical protein